MKQITIRPGRLHGAITPPPSKSAAHRALICAALAHGRSRIAPYTPSDDIDATIDAVRTLGAYVRVEAGGLTVDGCGGGNIPPEQALLDCAESGSTLRFLIPVAAALGRSCTFIGAGRLPQRPIGPYLDCLPPAGVPCETAGGLPLTLSGRLRPGIFRLPGNVSSQFVTGLLMALPLLDGDSCIVLTSPLESAGYIDLTLDMMRRFGVRAESSEDGYDVPGRQHYIPCAMTVEADWSQAAFWLAAGALGGPVVCHGLDGSSRQGDREIRTLLTRFGAPVSFMQGAPGRPDVSAQAGDLGGIEIDAAQIPDLVPVLAALACFAGGRTTITHAARLRIKESDRLHAVAQGLSALGARVRELPDGLTIEPSGHMRGGEVSCAGDHRIAMALAVAALRCDGPTVLDGAECVRKSYPSFFDDFVKLGGIVHVVDMG